MLAPLDPRVVVSCQCIDAWTVEPYLCPPFWGGTVRQVTYLLILGKAVRGERSLQGDVACQGSAGRRGGSSSQTGVGGVPLLCGPLRTAALVMCRRLSRRTGSGAPPTGSAQSGQECRQPEMRILGTELGGVRAADDPAAG